MLRFEVQHYWMSEYVHVQLNGIPLLFCSNLKIQGNQAILRGIDPRVHIQNAGGQRQVLLKLPPSPPIFFHFRDGSINNGMAPVICTPSLFSLFPLLFGSMLLFFLFLVAYSAQKTTHVWENITFLFVVELHLLVSPFLKKKKKKKSLVSLKICSIPLQACT